MNLGKMLLLIVLIFQVGLMANDNNDSQINQKILDKVIKIQKELNTTITFTPAKFRENNESYLLTVNAFIAYEAFSANEDTLKDHVNFGMSSYLEYPYAHFYGSVYLKESAVDENTTNNSTKVNIGMFLPFISGLAAVNNYSFRKIRSENNFSKIKSGIYENQPKFGMLVEGSATKLGSDLKAKREGYLGLRYALSPYRYFDVMYGKAIGLHYKIKIRTEYQLNTSLIFGVLYDFEPTSKDVKVENQDVIKVYMRAPISLDLIKKMIKI